MWSLSYHLLFGFFQYPDCLAQLLEPSVLLEEVAIGRHQLDETGIFGVQPILKDRERLLDQLLLIGLLGDERGPLFQGALWIGAELLRELIDEIHPPLLGVRQPALTDRVMVTHQAEHKPGLLSLGEGGHVGEDAVEVVREVWREEIF